MPLLEGKFDPVRFNAVTLAPVLYENVREYSAPLWDSLTVTETSDPKRHWIDVAQNVLDQLWHSGVIR